MASSPTPPASPRTSNGGPSSSRPTRSEVVWQQVSSCVYHGWTPKSIHLTQGESIFNPQSPQIKSDIIRMIIQYLANEGYVASMMTIQDEANVKFTDHHNRHRLMNRLTKLILEGEWGEVEKLCTKQNFKANLKALQYAIYRQQYLEAIEKQEYQKAFSLLTKRVKPVEGMQTHPNEVKDLCYLLTCKSVTDVPSFKSWDGIQHSREQLVEQFQSMLEFDPSENTHSTVRVPPNRLVTLLQQAVAYQIEFSRYHPKTCPNINTLLEEYKCPVLPNAERHILRGHRQNVKCVAFVGTDADIIASGSSDNTVRLWNTDSGDVVLTLGGHTSRIWDISSAPTAAFIASASGDSTVKIWDVPNGDTSAVQTLRGHEGDVYGVDVHRGETHVATAGYDKTTRLFDVSTGQLVKTFTGHNSSVTKACFNNHGNLIITASKDTTIKLWDVVSGLCIKTVQDHVGEVTSVQMSSSGNWILSASKDNSNRLWDIRTGRAKCEHRFKGHQNTSKNFIRACFGPNDNMVVSGSEDGLIYMWDIETSQLLQRLSGHNGPVYAVAWSAPQCLLASCSQDCTVRTWWYDQSKPLFAPDIT